MGARSLLDESPGAEFLIAANDTRCGPRSRPRLMQQSTMAWIRHLSVLCLLSSLSYSFKLRRLETNFGRHSSLNVETALDKTSLEVDSVNSASQDDQIRKILKGRHKWLGGATDSEGCVYGIPSHSKHVICLSPTTDGDTLGSSRINLLALPSDLTQTNDGNKNRDHQFKWLRGIISGGRLFGIPAWCGLGVLSVDIEGWRKFRESNPGRRLVDDDEISSELISVLPLPDSSDGAVPKRWMWHGAAMNKNATAIYCVPSNAERILKVDLLTMATTYIEITPRAGVTLEEHAMLLGRTNKFYGGILGDDNAVYGMPYAAGSVLRVDCNTDRAELIGDFGWGKYNFHGGIKAGLGIYAFPAHSDNVLKINTTAACDGGDGCSRLSLLPIERAPYDDDTVSRYKWLGGSMGADGNIYGMPSDASSVLKIDVEADRVTTFGQIESSRLNEDGSPYVEKNKWQGGVLARDGFVYAIPSDSQSVLRIDTRPLTEGEQDFPSRDRVSCFGDLARTKDKYQGGFAVGDVIYAIPENADEVLRVVPSEQADKVTICTL